MPNRSIRDERQSASRPKAGPADDATRKQMLKERFAEREPPGLYAKPAEAKTPQRTATLNPIRNLKERNGKLDQAIEESGG